MSRRIRFALAVVGTADLVLAGITGAWRTVLDARYDVPAFIHLITLAYLVAAVVCLVCMHVGLWRCPRDRRFLWPYTGFLVSLILMITPQS
jgi:ABC-type xylose transport system permease subunit